MHNAEITYNGKEITYLQMAQLPCGALAAIIDTKNSKTCPVIAGFDASSTQFLAGYSYQSKTHEPISDDPRYSLEQFICEMNSLARQNGVKPSPKRVEINSYVPGTSVLCADVIMSDAPKNKYPMIPSHSLLLAALFNVPAFLDDELYRDE